MNLSIKGKLTKIDGEWVAEFKYLNIRMKAPTAFKSVMAVSDYITSQLEGKDTKCSVRIDEDGVFYLSTTRPRPLIKFIALCLTKNFNEMSYDHLNDWFAVED